LPALRVQIPQVKEQQIKLSEEGLVKGGTGTGTGLEKEEHAAMAL